MDIKELHLFAGIGGGIYGGKLLNHSCCGAVEIDDFCKSVLKLRQEDNYLNQFPIYGDISQLNGADFKNSFDILCGGHPCQAFSHAAHGRNIKEKDLWYEMFRFVKQSNAPIVFAENVSEKAISIDKSDLESIGYKTQMCRLSCEELGGDHRRIRYWLLAVKDFQTLSKISENLKTLPKLDNSCWVKDFTTIPEYIDDCKRKRLKGIGNAQSPIVAATAFRVLVNRFENNNSGVKVAESELLQVFSQKASWIKQTYGHIGLIHTPTTMANYSADSMQKHEGCRNFVRGFEKPTPTNAEYLMGFPAGATYAYNLKTK